MGGREKWPLSRMNANGDRRNALAGALRDAWRSGDKSWLDLAGIALGMLKPASAEADAVFTIELHPDRSQVHTQAGWGGDPADLLDRAVAALMAERVALAACPFHLATAPGGAARVHEQVSPPIRADLETASLEDRAALREEVERLKHQVAGYQHHLRASEQIAGQALGYPWFKDDQKNFPGSTEDDGVCIGDHVGDTIVEELATAFHSSEARARAAEEALKESTEVIRSLLKVAEVAMHELGEQGRVSMDTIHLVAVEEIKAACFLRALTPTPATKDDSHD